MNVKKEKKTYLEAIGLFIWVGSLLSMFLVGHMVTVVTSLMMSNVVYILLAQRSSYEEGPNRTYTRYALAGVSIVLACGWLFAGNSGMLILLQMLDCYVGIFEVVLHLLRKKEVWKKGGDILTRVGFVGWILLTLMLSVVSLILLYVAVFPDSLSMVMRGNAENVVEAPASQTVKLSNGKYMTNDIQYSERYANGYFDLYGASDDFSEVKPVFIYLHGGFWVYGDKVNGDPNAEEIVGFYKIVNRLVDEGFHVISVNYALAPEFSYPTPIHQMEDLAVFLKEHGAEYGLDTNRLVFGGGGSGAQIAAQFVLTQTNADYAKELHIEQILTEDEIKAVYLGTALLDPSKVTDSDVFFVDYFLYQMARSYFSVGSLGKDARTAQANIIKHMTGDFPATYITDGNYMSYFSQARKLSEKFEKLGVEYEFLHFNEEKYVGEMIMQGYDILDSEFADMNLEKMTAFLREYVLDAKIEK